MTRGFSTTSSSASASLSQSRTLSSRPLSLGTSNFALHFLQRAVRPPNSTGRRYFAPQLVQLHLMKSATTHLVPCASPESSARRSVVGAGPLRSPTYELLQLG